MPETINGFIFMPCVAFFVVLLVAQHGSIAKELTAFKQIGENIQNRENVITIDNDTEERNAKTEVNHDTIGPTLQQGTTLYRLISLGLHGPGKSVVNIDADGLSGNERVNEDSDDDSIGNQEEDIMVCLPLSKLRQGRHGQLQSVGVVPKQLLSKRRTTDFGYGSLVEAAGNVARSYVDSGIFGIAGPGKRSMGVGSFYKRGGLATDSGYGSRIQTGEMIARDYDTFNNLYGNYGPGRRKRGKTEKMGELDELSMVTKK